MATRAPSSMKRFAVANPIPLLPPVTTAVLPSSRFISTSAPGGPQCPSAADFDSWMNVLILGYTPRVPAFGSRLRAHELRPDWSRCEARRRRRFLTLKILSDAGLIESRRAGQFVYSQARLRTLPEYTRALPSVARKKKK